jgi:hypothetical protein
MAASFCVIRVVMLELIGSLITELTDPCISYERIMGRMKRNLTAKEWEIAQKLLGWMVCAKRPLKWHEIQGAVSMDLDGQTIDFDDRKLRTHIQELCGSLIQVLQGDRIELVHNTARM